MLCPLCLVSGLLRDFIVSYMHLLFGSSLNASLPLTFKVPRGRLEPNKEELCAIRFEILGAGF